MKFLTSMPRLKGFRFPREIVAYTVWAYHRFALSTADVEDLLAVRVSQIPGQYWGFGWLVIACAVTAFCRS